jgi:hypothetical protein
MGKPVTRKDLGRQLALNATFKPVNIAAPAAVVVVGLLLGVPAVALPVAVLLYVVLWLQTFFDSREAERVGKATYGERPRPAVLDASRLDPEIARPLEQARATAASIRAAVQEADQPMDDVVGDVDVLVGAMETSAKRAQLIADTLKGQDLAGIDRDIARRANDLDPDVRALVDDLRAQRASIVRLQDKLERFQVGMERISASLGLLRTSVAEMSASEEEAAQRELSTQARELRERTQLLAESMAESFST